MQGDDGKWLHANTRTQVAVLGVVQASMVVVHGVGQQVRWWRMHGARELDAIG